MVQGNLESNNDDRDFVVVLRLIKPIIQFHVEKTRCVRRKPRGYGSYELDLMLELWFTDEWSCDCFNVESKNSMMIPLVIDEGKQVLPREFRVRPSRDCRLITITFGILLIRLRLECYCCVTRCNKNFRHGFTLRENIIYYKEELLGNYLSRLRMLFSSV